MNVFITLTTRDKTEVRVNINHISYYQIVAVAGIEETCVILGSNTLWVSETLQEIDQKIQETLDQNNEQESKNEAMALIKTVRSKLNLTQRQLGAILGVGRLTVSRWETGHRIISAERQDQLREMLSQHESRYHSFDTLDIYNKVNKINQETT